MLTASVFFNATRPANVPKGAHIQWEIELLGFEMPRVILCCLRNSIQLIR